MKTNATIAAGAIAAEADPCLKVEVCWNLTDWVDESAYVVSASGESQIADPIEGLLSLGQARLATANVRVRNVDGRYSVGHTASQAATYGIERIPIRISAGYSGEYARVFTGRIMDAREGESSEDATLTCHDNGSDAKRQQLSSTVYSEYPTASWLAHIAAGAGVGAWTMEYGLLTIPFAYLDDDEALAEMRKAAASEGGILLWDADGTLRYWNAAHWIGAASVATLDRTKFAELEPSRKYDNVYNMVSVDYSPRRVGQPATVYALKRPIFVPPSGTKSVVLNFSWPLRTFDSYTMYAASGGGADMTSSVSLSLSSPDYAKRWTLTFTNADTRQEAIIQTFQVLGYPLDGRNSETYVEDQSGAALDRQTAVRGNPYIQTEEQARFVAALLAQRLKTVRPVYRATDMRANPLIELGDVVTLGGSVTIGASVPAIVTAIQWQFADAYTMGLSCMDKSGLYGFTESEYWKVGTSTPSSGRLYI